MESTAQNRRPRQVWFCSSDQLQPDAQKLRLRMHLWIELSQTVIRSPVFFRKLFPDASLGEDTKSFYFMRIHTW